MSDSDQQVGQWIPEIQGMRAVSIIGVILFHAELGFPGGFVGVDVFFVISGFLITRIILADLRSGRFSFGLFYERRVRRIVPALLCLLVCVLLLGWFLARPADFSRLGATAAAQCIGLGNFVLWRSTGYFAADSASQPLLHMWSLAVEEQFYFILPVFLWLNFRRDRGTFYLSLWPTLAGFLCCSLWLNLACISSRPSAVFFLLPTRAWEMLAGCLLAEAGGGPRRVSGWISTCCLWCGFSTIIACMLCYSGGDEFPGWRAMLPVSGAAAMIAGLYGAGDCILRSVLRSRVLLYVGNLSYSLYLWHWPFLAGATMLLPWELSGTLRASLVLVAFPLAAMSVRILEDPIRHRKLFVSRTGLFVSAAAMSGVIVVFGTGVWILNGWPERFTGGVAEQLAFHDGDRPWTTVQSDDHLLRSGGEQWIGSVEASAKTWGLLWGDSHAMAIVPALAAALSERGLNAGVVAHTATAPVLGWYNVDRLHGLNEQSESLGREVFRLLERRNLRNVLLVACWSYYDCDGMRQALLRTVRQCREMDINVWVMTQVPFQPLPAPRVLWYAAMTGEDARVYSAKVTGWNGISGNGEAFLSELQMAGVQILDIRPQFLDSLGGCYVMQHEGRSLYADSNHLTPFGAETMVLPILRSELFKSRTAGTPNGGAVPEAASSSGQSD